MKESATAILNYLIKKSRKGLRFDEVVAMYLKETDSKESERAGIKEQFKREIENYPNFDFVQKMLTYQYIKCADTNKHYLIDAETKKVEIIREEALKSAFDTEAFKWINACRLYTTRLGYNPNAKDFLYEDGLLKAINMYRPAEWQIEYFFEGKAVPKVGLHEKYDAFLKHLTDSELSYRYLLTFMASCVQANKKAYSYCTLLGKQGIGKGVFFQILSQLVGPSNASEIPATCLADMKFNDAMKHKKLLFFDELTIRNPEDDSVMKKFVNPSITIESKGIDAKEYVNYACIMVASNNLGNLKIEPDDRRYSFVDLTDNKLTEFVANKYPEMTQNEYVQQYLLEPASIKQLGEFLLNYEIDEKLTENPIKSEASKSQKFNRLLDWEVDVFNQLAPENAGKEITLVKAKEEIQRITDNSKISPNRARWVTLSETSPGYFTVQRKNEKGKRFYVLKFEELDKMPKFIASEKEE